MGAGEILQLASQFGVAGLLVGYIFLLEANNRKDRREQAKDRLDIDRETNATNLRLATALEALKIYIMGRDHV